MSNRQNKVNQFFQQKLFLDKSNRNYQMETLKELNKINFPFSIFSESRNYQHSISIVTDFNTNGDPATLNNDDNDYSREFIHSFFNSKIYRVLIEFSDVDKIYKVNWGVKNYLNESEKWFSTILPHELPECIQKNFKSIESHLQKTLDCTKLNQEELNTKVDMFDFKNSDYTPTLEELLFGGLDLYNALGI